MSLPYRQQHRLHGLRRGLLDSEPRLASMLAMFAKLYAGDAIPAWEQVRRRLPGPVRALAHACWALLCLGGRVLLGCARLLHRCARRLLSRCGWFLHPCGRFLRRAALRCLLTWRFLPTGCRLTAGAWLMAHHRPAPVPPAAPRG